MRILRRLLAAAAGLALALMPVLASAAPGETFAEGMLIYRDLGGGQCEVAALGEEGIGWEVIEIPETVRGLTVVRIGDGALLDRDSIRTLLIPDSVTSIGRDAFRHCNNLREVQMPPQLTAIGERAFSMCGQLREIGIPSGLSEIPAGCFYACSVLKTVTVPEGVKTIGDQAFYSCRSLESADMPAGLERIGEAAFEACERLRDINLPAALNILGPSAFAFCPRLVSITLPEGLSEISSRTFAGCGRLEAISIPESVARIGDNAFRSCIALSEVTIYGRPYALGDRAFAYCSKLGGIILPDGLRSIGSEAFLDVSVQASLPATLLSIGDSAFNAEDCRISYAGSPAMWQSVIIGAGNDGLADVQLSGDAAEAAGLAAAAGSELEVTGLEGSSVDVIRGLTAGRTAPPAALLYDGIVAPDGAVEVYSADGLRLAGDGSVGTGTIVQGEAADGTFLGRAHVIVRGDLFGTGVVNIGQLVAVAQALTGARALTPLQLAAADLNGSGAVDIADLVLEAQLLGKAA